MEANKICYREEFREYLRDKELSENTISVYIYAVKKYLQYQGQGEVTERSVRRYKEELKEEYKESSSNLYLIALNQYLKWYGYEECCIPIKSIRRKKRVENVLDKEEYQRLLDYTMERNDKKYYAIIRTLAGTGIRISELKYITTDAIRTGMAEVCNKGKTREVYIGRPLQEVLTAYCKSKCIMVGCIFVGNRQEPITRGAINQKLGKIAEAAGVDKKKVHPHAFRHLFAKEYMKKHGNIAELSCVLGHESVETTMIYLANSSREYIAKLSVLDL